MKIPNIRLQNQQLLNPLFRKPKELVSWMGAMQAQNYPMVKWAVGMRLKSATIQTVEKALRDGEILRPVNPVFPDSTPSIIVKNAL